MSTWDKPCAEKYQATCGCQKDDVPGQLVDVCPRPLLDDLDQEEE